MAEGVRFRKRDWGCRFSETADSRVTLDLPGRLEAGVEADGKFGLSASELSKLVEEREEHTERHPSVGQLATALRTSLESGIRASTEGIGSRIDAFGENKLPKAKPVTFLQLVWEALEDPTIVVLLLAGAASLLLGNFVSSDPADKLEAIAIMLAVAVVVLVTATTNYQKESQFQKLNTVKDDIKVRVVREGKEVAIRVGELLVGDVLLVEMGDILPADGVLFQGQDMRVDESHLTGESEEVFKSPEAARYLLSGSKVLEGCGRMLVLSVGVRSQQGMIMTMLEGGQSAGSGDGAAVPDALDAGGPAGEQGAVLKQKLEEMAEVIGSYGLAAAIATFLLMAGRYTWTSLILQGQPWSWGMLDVYLHQFIVGITVLVVAVPEGLPLAVTLALAFSVQRMLTDNNLVRHLGACETMGCATTVCTDKTGTLTQNKMQVVRMWLAGTSSGGSDGLVLSEDWARMNMDEKREAVSDLAPEVMELMVQSVVLNSTANVQQGDDGTWTESGNQTECALLRMCAGFGCDVEALREAAPPLRQYTFSSERKRMSVVVSDKQSGAVLFSKGAAEIMLGLATHRLQPDGTELPLDEPEKEELMADFAAQGLRMLCLCYRRFPTLPPGCEDGEWRLSAEQAEQGLTLMALVGLEDNIRHEVPLAVQQCQRAGITVRMLTGDNRITATAIARDAGILPKDFPLPLSAHHHAPDADSAPAAGGAGTAAPSALAAAAALGVGRTGSSAAAAEPCCAHSSNGTGAAGGAAAWAAQARRGAFGSERCGGGVGGGSTVRELMVLEGHEFRQLVQTEDGHLDHAAFAAIFPHLRVLARCSPRDKYVIVTGCQAMGMDLNGSSSNGRRRRRPQRHEVVAMTGDGTNDAPALRIADVGFAMNSGTGIAKDAADIVLMDDNFSSIVSAVRWGRNVHASISKFLQFQLTINIVAVVTACVGAAFLDGSPLTAIQMLWVNMIMDSLASLALATEKPTDALLDQPPYRADLPLLSPILVKNIAVQACFQMAVMYLLVFHGLDWLQLPDRSVQMTMVFNSFVMMQLFNQVASRKIGDEANIVEDLQRNPTFLGILGTELVIQALIVQFGGSAFSTVPLNGEQWGVCLGFGALSLVVRAAGRMIPVPANYPQHPKQDLTRQV